MDQLKDQLIRLGSTNPDLRKHLRPILDVVTKTGGIFEAPPAMVKSIREWVTATYVALT